MAKSVSNIWLTVDDISAHLGIKKSTVYQYVSDGRIPHHRIPGSNLVRFKQSEIDGWMETGRIETQDEYLERIVAERSD